MRFDCRVKKGGKWYSRGKSKVEVEVDVDVGGSWGWGCEEEGLWEESGVPVEVEVGVGTAKAVEEEDGVSDILDCFRAGYRKRDVATEGRKVLDRKLSVKWERYSLGGVSKSLV